ncbi:hypothetical protein [Mangrovihabitans endophyticus]|uniref:hypothetical protein n=1 Tax=Mangrovihabitans endophyticus TaxID=1751298 RepID=UPI00166C358A|nr:hypothetical protein [Mangrovihabitans endophyticus]
MAMLASTTASPASAATPAGGFAAAFDAGNSTVSPAGTSPSPSGDAADTPGPAKVSTDARAYAEALASPDWVKTPSGLMNKECVHKLPEGATVDGDDIVLASGAKRQLDACKHPRLVRPGKAGPTSPAVRAAPDQAVPTSNGWMISTWWNAPTWLRRLYVNYAVPTAPHVNGSTTFLFSSFEPSGGNAIIQPVLTYGPSASGGGNYWYITSWYVWGGNSVYGSNVRVSPGDTIWGAMEGNSCNSDGRNCHWAIRTVNQTAGGESRIDITSYSVYTTAQGGVLESYGAQHCNMLPANHHGVFRNIEIWGPTFNKLTPSWFVWQPDPECSMYEQFTTNSADIWWTE